MVRASTWQNLIDKFVSVRDMDQPRPCGCKGRRSCLICEKEYGIQPQSSEHLVENTYEYCHHCKKAWKSFNLQPYKEHPQHKGSSIAFPGLYIEHDFINENEKQILLNGINSEPWSLSQSGRRKQNYGPRCNFKKTKIQKRDFIGFPKFSQFIHDKLKKVDLLYDFQVIEQCVLEYDPKRGASIDPHIDDCWIWGERIVTLNVLGDTYLTMTKYKGDTNKYNLNHVEKYASSLINGKINENTCIEEDVHVKIFMPEKSLIVLYGSARYDWEHSIPREDIKDYRLCIAYREFTPPYLIGDFKEIGDEIQELAKTFW